MIPGEELRLKENAEKASLGETITAASSLGFYEVTVDEVRLTDDRTESLLADKVLRVTYTYASTDYDAELMVSSLFFRLYGSDGKACAPYILGDKGKEPAAKPLSPGERCTANIYFALAKDSSTATLVFDDITETGDPAEYYWELRLTE